MTRAPFLGGLARTIRVRALHAAWAASRASAVAWRLPAVATPCRTRRRLRRPSIAALLGHSPRGPRAATIVACQFPVKPPRAIGQHVPAEHLWAVPDCGFWETPRWLAFSKLQALVQGTA